jgi:hypothetical protein
VKKNNRILSPIAKPAVVIPPVIPVMDAASSIYTYLRFMWMEQCERFAPVCSSKCSSSKPVKMLGQAPDYISVPVLFYIKTIHDELLKQVEAMSPVTHVATGTLREIPLYKATRTEGDSHFLVYPARLTVKKALKAFLEQKTNFGPSVVDRHPINEMLFKDWTEVPCIQPEGTVTPLQMFVIYIPKGDQEKSLNIQQKGIPCSSRVASILSLAVSCYILVQVGWLLLIDNTMKKKELSLTQHLKI